MNVASMSGALPVTAIESIRRKVQEIPEVGKGWRTFNKKIREWQDRRGEAKTYWQEVDARAREHGGNKVFTRGNFLRFASIRASELAFHFAMTGDEVSFEMAAELADLVCAEPRWTAQAARNAWQSDLWTADYTASVAMLTSLIGFCAGSAREAGWKQALMDKGIRPLLAEWVDPATRIHALDSMGHNWWSVCVSGAALGLFCTREEFPKADDWLGRIADGFVEFFEYPGNVLQNKHRTFGADGDYIEPLGYLDYTLHHAVLMFDLHREILGRDLAAELPVLKKLADYYLGTLQPVKGGLQRLNFGNMGWGPMSMGNENHSPASSWLWLAGRFGRGELLHLIRRWQRWPSTLLEFLFWPEEVQETDFGRLPHEAIFENSGLAVLRDGFEPESTVFALRTGEKWNHNHADAGSFILSSGGREFIVDPGTAEYTSPLNSSFFWSSEGHNVILHKGKGQNEELHHLGTKFPGRIAESLITPGYRYVLADATGPWEGTYQRFYRHVLWVDGCIVLIDDLMAPDVGPWTQLLHYRGRATTQNARTEIENDGKTLVIHHVHPAPSGCESRQGYIAQPVANPWKHESEIEREPYLALQYPGRERREKFIQVLELPGGMDKQVEPFEGKGFAGVRIGSRRKSWEITCNLLADGRTMHQNAWNRLGEWITDAFLLVVERDGNGHLEAVSFHNGSSVKYQGETLYSSLLKGEVRIRYERRGLHIASSMRAATWADIRPPGQAEAERVHLGAAQQEAHIPARTAAVVTV